MKSLIPVVMAGIIAVYGLVVSVLIVGGMSPTDPYSLYQGFIHLAAGLACGLSGMAAGHAIGPSISHLIADSARHHRRQCRAILPLPAARFRRYGAHAQCVVGLEAALTDSLRRGPRPVRPHRCAHPQHQRERGQVLEQLCTACTIMILISRLRLSSCTLGIARPARMLRL